jgi:hypothetical protein
LTSKKSSKEKNTAKVRVRLPIIKAEKINRDTDLLIKIKIIDIIQKKNIQRTTRMKDKERTDSIQDIEKKDQIQDQKNREEARDIPMSFKITQAKEE